MRTFRIYIGWKDKGDLDFQLEMEAKEYGEAHKRSIAEATRIYNINVENGHMDYPTFEEICDILTLAGCPEKADVVYYQTIMQHMIIHIEEV